MHPNEVDTRIGMLTLDHGIPTEEASGCLCDYLDFNLAEHSYLWSLPIVGHK
ncbi:MAG: hypothetical protein ABJI96_02475 [Paracoccaceae bacterium]